MLLSQQMIHNPLFLEQEKERLMTLCDFSVANFKQKVKKSVKLVIKPNHDNRLVREGVKSYLFGTDKPDAALVKKKFAFWQQYAKLPFPLLFIENEYYGMLLKEVPEGGFTLTAVMNYNGMQTVLPYHIRFNPNVPLGDGSCLSVSIPETYARIIEENPDVPTGFLDRQYHVSWFYLMEALIILSTLNACNVVVHKYTPNKKELKQVPLKHQKFYEYRILDLYREKTVYHSLEEVTASSRVTQTGSARRAHIVRGHFKERNGKLFWWNPFLRCRNNLETTGLVDKDYRLNP